MEKVKIITKKQQIKWKIRKYQPVPSSPFD